MVLFLSKTEDKHDDFDIVVSIFLMLHSEGVYISQLIRLARVSSHIADSDTRNKTF